MKICLPMLLLCLSLQAQKKNIVFATRHNSLILSIGNNQRLYQAYLGKKLSSDTMAVNDRTVQEAYLTAGMENSFEPAIRMVHADGNPSLELRYVQHTSNKKDNDNNVTITDIELRDPVYPVTVTLHYTTYYDEDIITVSSTISHQEKKPVLLTQFASSMLHFNAGHYWLTQFHGDWAREANMEETALPHGITIVDSKLGSRANMYRSPFFFLSLNELSDENKGELIAGTLAWTGNFQFTFESDQRDALRMIAGMNPYASEYHLEPGEVFNTPAFIFTYSDAGRGQASRNFHRWARNYSVLDGHQPRLTLLNNWEATGMKFDEPTLVHLFDGASQLGVDLFLLDDGWFGNHFPRDDDKKGLGDWQPNTAKLPHGVNYLATEAQKKNIRFGIWLEPEMVNPKSDLYEQHPDWILKLPNRDEHYQRNQLVLDLTNPKVQDFVYGIVDEMLTKNPGVSYIKWDCNRTMTNAYSAYLKEKQSHLYIQYTRSWYKVLDRIRAKYPHLPIMLCSGGGGRTDYGALKYFTEFWPSDNTNALERVFIQWGYSYFFPSNTLSAHVTGWSKQQSLKFKTDVAMMGKLGYDIQVSSFTDKEMQFSREAVQTYKRISDVIWNGDLYRLVSPYSSNRAVLMYVNADKTKAILFNYNLNTRYKDVFDRVRLDGLDATKKYSLQEINLFPDTKPANPDNGKVLSGEYLMTIGLDLTRGRVNPATSNVYEIAAR